MEKNCKICGKPFKTKPSRWRAKYCSHACHSKGQAVPKEIKTCPTCGKVFKSQRSATRKYCSYPCSTKFGKDNPNWRGGKRKTHRGYIRITIAPYKRKYEHILIIEKKLGRKLKANELVHHINGVKHDNRVENLRVMTIAEHTILHMTKT